MVEFDKQDRSKDSLGDAIIWDVDGKRGVVGNVREAIDKCRGDDSRLRIPTSIELTSPVIIYGSYARGTAVKGESDLDIIIPVVDSGRNVSPILSNVLEACISDHEDVLVDGFEEWFDGADVTVITDNMKWVMALRFAIGRDEGKGRVVYNLQNDRLVDEDEIVEKIVEQIAEGELSDDEIDIKELEASPVKEYNVNLIRDTLRGGVF